MNWRKGIYGDDDEGEWEFNNDYRHEDEDEIMTIKITIERDGPYDRDVDVWYEEKSIITGNIWQKGKRPAIILDQENRKQEFWIHDSQRLLVEEGSN